MSKLSLQNVRTVFYSKWHFLKQSVHSYVKFWTQYTCLLWPPTCLTFISVQARESALKANGFYSQFQPYNFTVTRQNSSFYLHFHTHLQTTRASVNALNALDHKVGLRKVGHLAHVHKIKGLFTYLGCYCFKILLKTCEVTALESG